jgi:hypothetical protein
MTVIDEQVDLSDSGQCDMDNIYRVNIKKLYNKIQKIEQELFHHYKSVE